MLIYLTIFNNIFIFTNKGYLRIKITNFETLEHPFINYQNTVIQ